MNKRMRRERKKAEEKINILIGDGVDELRDALLNGLFGILRDFSSGREGLFHDADDVGDGKKPFLLTDVRVRVVLVALVASAAWTRWIVDHSRWNPNLRKEEENMGKAKKQNPRHGSIKSKTLEIERGYVMVGGIWENEQPNEDEEASVTEEEIGEAEVNLVVVRSANDGAERDRVRKRTVNATIHFDGGEVHSHRATGRSATSGECEKSIPLQWKSIVYLI
ncbi:hypothetical protein SESBI_14945 [Sesbania bispinosa]|nr:hypothetical protein SESBI_14945 [Sesbania bispinosa]